MKAAISLLILGLLFLQGEALRCRQSSCTGRGSCSARIQTCTGSADHCFSLITTMGYNVYLTRGCITRNNCATMKALHPNTNCCSTELCN